MAELFIVVNAGSSSLKFQVYEAAARSAAPLFKGLFEGLGAGTPEARVTIRNARGDTVLDQGWPAPDDAHDEALTRLLNWTRDALAGTRLAGVGHRVVHGGPIFDQPVIVDDAILAELGRFVPLAPLHQPHNLKPIRLLRERMPELPQVACFDTAFHRTQPGLAQLFPLPKALTDAGVIRYGFHGLSYEYIASAMGDYDSRLAAGRVIVAHLGNGASACAMQAGRSVANTMGFSALDGLMMGTRSGAIDPGVIFYLMREMKKTPEQAEQFLYSECGLLGVSGLSSDMRTLRASGHPSARQATDLFVYRIVREAGSLVAALGGIDGLIFTGGIGENDAATRAGVVDGLGFAGFRLDATANQTGAARISAGDGPVAWVIPTNEELVVVRHMRTLLATT